MLYFGQHSGRDTRSHAQFRNGQIEAFSKPSDLGADLIKIFPAEFFGPAYIKSLRAVFPKLDFLPTGGVTTRTLGDFLRAGAFATAAGSALVEPAALKARDWAAVTARAREFAAAAAAA